MDKRLSFTERCLKYPKQDNSRIAIWFHAISYTQTIPSRRYPHARSSFISIPILLILFDRVWQFDSWILCISFTHDWSVLKIPSNLQSHVNHLTTSIYHIHSMKSFQSNFRVWITSTRSYNLIAGIYKPHKYLNKISMLVF